MAEAWAKVTGAGICFVHAGAGATNASIGVHTAQQDSTPMILFIGQVPGEFSDANRFRKWTTATCSGRCRNGSRRSIAPNACTSM